MKKFQWTGWIYQSFRLIVLFLVLCEIFTTNYARNKDHKITANRISGFVYDERRKPIADVFVELQNDLYSSVQRTKTDDGGRYIFSGMPLGNYYVHVIPTKGDWEEQSIRVEINSLVIPSRNNNNNQGLSPNTTNNEEVFQDFYLKPRSPKSFLTGVIFAQDIPQEANSLYEKSIELINQNNLNEAIASLKLALEKFPEYFLALNRLGYIYFEQNRFDLASEMFAKAADINPRSEPTIYLLSLSVFQLKKYSTAITFLNGAIELKHNSSRIYLLLGKSLRMVKKYEEAENNLKIAENLDHKNPETHWELALIYGRYLKKFEVAAKQLEIFLKLQPDSKDKDQINKLISEFKEKARQRQ